MVRGRGPRGGSYRGSGGRGHSWNGNGRGSGNYSNSGFRPSFSSDSRGKYHSSERFSSGRPSYMDDYGSKPYRSDSSYMGRESARRSPERKRMRSEASSSRYDSSFGGYGSSRNELSGYSERRSYAGERHPSSPSFSKKEDYRIRPSGPPSRGSYRGRISSRGFRCLRARDRPLRRRLVDSSYSIRKRVFSRTPSFRRQRIARIRSSISKRELDEDDLDKEMSSPEDKEETTNEDKEIKKEVKDEEDKVESLEDKLKKRKSFVKLVCPHCNIKVLTFSRYERHLMSRTHMFSMKRVALKQRSILAQMRSAQRNTQNELEKDSDELSDQTNFCPLCKLNYKQKRAVHQLSEAHNNMKKFLMPECKSCNIAFKSPMSYEKHCCSIRHIKRQQRIEDDDDASGDGDNLEDFTTIDSIGEVDNDGGEVKEELNIGIEKVRRVEVYYCDLCRMYLPRAKEPDMAAILTSHCKQKVHIRRYQRFKENDENEQRETKEKLKKEKEIEEGTQVTETKVKVDEDEEAKDDKLWADVDKDLGDILAEAECGNKSSDEDEDDSHVNGERYDRFKLSINDGEAKEIEEK